MEKHFDLPQHPENPNAETASTNIQEIIISSEVLEGILEKVSDINEKGNGVTSVGHWDETGSLSIKLETILELGVLGFDKSKHDRSVIDFPKNDTEMEAYKSALKEKWYQEARKYRLGNPWINVVGRDIENVSQSWVKNKGSVGIILDLSNMNEAIPIGTQENGDEEVYKKLKVNHFKKKLSLVTYPNERTYYPDSPLYNKVGYVLNKLGKTAESIDYEDLKDELNQIRGKANQIDITEEQLSGIIEDVFNAGSIENIFTNGKNNYSTYSALEGFVAGRRIAPREFKGIVVNTEHLEDLEAELKNIIETMFKTSETKGKELLLPIYDLNGNMLWPKKMSHEEIVQIKEKEVAQVPSK